MNVLLRSTRASEPVTPASVVPLQPKDPPPAAAPRTEERAPRPYVGPSLISSALTVTGKLESAGDIQIDGKVDGDVKGQGVRIGAGAVIKGTVIGEVVELSGSIEGKIEANSAVLTKTAKMSGDIIHQTLQIEQGAHFNGSSRPKNTQPSP